jgi:hypothetical protein
VDWLIPTLIGAGVVWLAWQAQRARREQLGASASAGLDVARDLSHISPALQRTALWSLAEGGFETRVVHNIIARNGIDISVTAFDLETLRERRGEWAWLPVEPPFRIGGLVSVVICELDRTFPHTLLKRAGRGDQLAADPVIGTTNPLVKGARAALGLPPAYEAELPATLATQPLAIELPVHWRAYAAAIDPVLGSEGLYDALAQTKRRDLVVELIDSLVVVYPAALDVSGADAFADLVETALAIVDGLRAGHISPRGIEP